MKILFKSYQQLLLISSLICLFSFQTTALNYYWVGGSGNWSDLNHWATTSGGTTLQNEIPTALDDVFFDANSFSAPGQIVTLDPSTIFAHDLNWTGVTNTPTMTGLLASLLKIYGSLTFVTGINMTFMGDVNFEATTPGHTISMGTHFFNRDTRFNGIGGTWTLLDAFRTGNELFLNNGTLTTNDNAVTAGDFRSTTTTARGLNMGASVFSLSSVFDIWIANATNFTFNCGTSVINGTSSSAPNFWGGNLTYYDLNFTGADYSSGYIQQNNNFHDVSFSGYGNIVNSNTIHSATFHRHGTITGNNIFTDLNFTAGFSYALANGTTQTINGSFNANGNCGAFIEINPSTPVGTATITHTGGAVNTSFLVLKNVIANGSAFTANNSIDLGGNTGWTINALTAKNLYWIGNGGNWEDGSHWSLTSGGISSGCAPSPIDNVFFDANSFSSTGQSVNINGEIAYCKNMSWTGAANNPSLTAPFWLKVLKIYGSVNFISAMTQGFPGDVSFEAITPGQTITMAGKIFGRNVEFNGVGGGWTLQDALTASAEIDLNAGALYTNDQTVNATNFYAITSWGSSRTLSMGSSVFNLSNTGACWNVTPGNFNFNCGTSVINCTRSDWSPEFHGQGLTYYDLNFTGTQSLCYIMDFNHFHNVYFNSTGYINQSNNINIATFHEDGTMGSNNTYNELHFAAGHTYTLYSNTTQTVNNLFDANGICGNLINIQSSLQGYPATISHATTAVNCSFLILKDITATGAVFNAANSIDLGNNPGWTFGVSGNNNLYWIGDGGNWDDGNHWSHSSGGAPSGCSPTPNDNVFFDANSFSSAAQTVLVNAFTAYCRDMTWTGSTNNPTFAGPNANRLKIYGSLTFIANMTVSFTGPVDFESIAPGKTVSMGGQSFHEDATFNGIGGAWTLLDAFTTVASLVVLNHGTLNTNDQTVNASAFYSFPPNNATRTLNMGASVFNLSNSGFYGINNGNSVFWHVVPTGLTLNSGTSVINSTGNFLYADFSGGGFTYYDLHFNGTGLNILSQSIFGNNVFHKVSFAAWGIVHSSNNFHELTFQADGNIESPNTFYDLNFTPDHTYILTSGTTQTITNRWQIQGSCVSYIVLQSSVSGSFATVSKVLGSVLGYNIHMKDIHGTGGATFFAYTSVDLGGNAGWSFSTLPPLINPGAITGPSSVCPGATGVVYHTSPVAGSIYYQWSVPAGATIVSGQGDTIIVVNFGTATSGNVILQSFNGCNYAPGSSSLPVSITTGATPTVTIVANPSGPICRGTSITFTATATNTGGGTANYDFKINGTSVQSGNSNTYSTTTLSDNDQVSCGITISGSACVTSTNAVSNIIVIDITTGTPPDPHVSIVSNPGGTICSGTSVTFTATATNTGSGNVSYDFKVDGSSAQNSSSNTYTSTSLLNNNIVTCEITVAATVCNPSAITISNAIVMVVAQNTTPAVSISAMPGNTICSGANVSFTATIPGTGSTTYNFEVNGISVQNSSSNIYSTTTVSDGDIVSCDITISGGTCLATNTATSNTISMSVTSTTTPTIFISPANPNICLKEEITFTSAVNNGGSAPAYHWKLNGDYLQEFGSTFTTNNLHDGDIVTCLLSSNAPCIFDATPLSNGILVKVVDCECIPTVPNAFTPNGDGFNDKWIISGGNCTRQVAVSVYNRYGSLVYHSDDYHNDWYGTYQSKTCADGTYYYVIKAISQNGKEQVIKGNVTILR